MMQSSQWRYLTALTADRPGSNGEVCALQAEIRAEVVADYFATLNYHLPQLREPGTSVPRVFLTRLPSNLEQQPGVGHRKRLFLRSVLPLVLLEQERLRLLRENLMDLRAAEARGDSLPEETQAWLLETFALYNAKADDWETLLRRVDAVPVSIALAQAAMESGWGLSRFAQQGNSLFGQWTWKRRQSGLVPEEREEGERHRVRAFETLGDSVRSYMHNLNSHWAYKELREQRARLRMANDPLDGLAMVAGLRNY